MPDDEYPECDLVEVINRAGHIENLLNQVISNYVGPRAKAWTFMQLVLLDTAFISLGAKAKVAMSIAYEIKFKFTKDEKNALMEVINLRNSFAHNTTNAHCAYDVGKTVEENAVYYQFYTFDSAGSLVRTKRHEAYERFNKKYTEAKAKLIELIRAVNALVESERRADM